jgi:HEAT repeat protein
MESLAQVASSGSLVSVAIATLAPMLDHPLRDVRADAARALGATGGADAVPVLRARLAEEELLQVRLAIAEALRRLGESDEGNEGTK